MSPWPGLELLNWQHWPQSEGGLARVWNTLHSAAWLSFESCWVPLLSGDMFSPPIPLALDLEGRGSQISFLGFVPMCLSHHLWETFVLGQEH